MEHFHGESIPHTRLFLARNSGRELCESLLTWGEERYTSVLSSRKT